MSRTGTKNTISSLNLSTTWNYLNPLFISVEKIIKNIYQINYNLSVLLNKGLNEYYLCSLNLKKVIQGNELIIKILPYFRGIGNVSSDSMEMHKQILIFEKTKEKLLFRNIREISIFDTIDKKVKSKTVTKELKINLPIKN